MDVDATADWILINEFAKNIDAFHLSIHMFRDAGGLAAFVPWDFDLSMGQPTVQNALRPLDRIRIGAFAGQEQRHELRKIVLADQLAFRIVGEPGKIAGEGRWRIGIAAERTRNALGRAGGAGGMHRQPAGGFVRPGVV